MSAQYRYHCLNRKKMRTLHSEARYRYFKNYILLQRMKVGILSSSDCFSVGMRGILEITLALKKKWNVTSCHMEFTSWHRHGQRNWDLSEFPAYTGIISSKVNKETFRSLKMLPFPNPQHKTLPWL